MNLNEVPAIRVLLHSPPAAAVWWFAGIRGAKKEGASSPAWVICFIFYRWFCFGSAAMLSKFYTAAWSYWHVMFSIDYVFGSSSDCPEAWRCVKTNLIDRRRAPPSAVMMAGCGYLSPRPKHERSRETCATDPSRLSFGSDSARRGVLDDLQYVSRRRDPGVRGCSRFELLLPSGGGKPRAAAR